MRRRAFLVAPMALLAMQARAQSVAAFNSAVPGRALAFPRDHGSHPQYRTEWWYITCWVESAKAPDLGVQITFFRSRPGVSEGGGSRFEPSQLLFAHAAIADPALGRLRHDQRAARAGWGLAEASAATTDVHIGDWSLRLAGDRYRARIDAREFSLDLDFAATQPILPQGTRGLSRKGPDPAQASHYYSRPQLSATGSIAIAGQAQDVRGTGWLDHEWSSAYLDADSVGWDWTGVNLDDGRAFMAFRIRDRTGNVRWAGGALRERDGSVHDFPPADVRFTPLREWRSPRTGIAYPVSFRVQAGGLDIVLEPLFDDQELDSRASVGTIYWEGAVRTRHHDQVVGRGYLELTGYGGALKL